MPATPQRPRPGHQAISPSGCWPSIATLITLSLCRFVLFGLPSMVDGWYQEHKSWIYTLIGGGLLYAVFYLM